MTDKPTRFVMLWRLSAIALIALTAMVGIFTDCLPEFLTGIVFGGATTEFLGQFLLG